MRRISRRSPRVTRLLVLFICSSFLFSSLALAGGVSRGPGSPQDESRRGHPEAGQPAAALPNLDDVRYRRYPEPQAPAPIESTARRHRKPRVPRNGLRVGDPIPAGFSVGQLTTGQVSADNDETASSGAKKLKVTAQNKKAQNPTSRRLHHARSTTTPLFPTGINDDWYVGNFFSYTLGRAPSTSGSPSEQTYWYNMVRSAGPHGQPSMTLAVREMGMTLFESAEYAARNRTNHEYVCDLYETYLLRYPDSGGWTFWEGLLNPPNSFTREQVRRAFDESGEYINDVATIVNHGSISGAVASLASARMDHGNQSGDQVRARDAEWSTTLLRLPGRAGFDLSLGLSYSSAATWTKSGPYIYFDADNSSLSPGFRLGFPTIQEPYFDAAIEQNVYLLITSAGTRIELQQVGATNNYTAGDSSYLELTDNGASGLLLRSSDGTQMSYSKIESEYHCTNIKDRNGNFITTNYNSLGDLTTVVDTLNRTVTFNYDANTNLTSITQMWNGQPHTYATFSWDNKGIQPSFAGAALVGCGNGIVIPMVVRMYFDDGTFVDPYYPGPGSGAFAQTGIVAAFTRFSPDNQPRAYTAFDFTTDQGDTTPRIADNRVWAQGWTGSNGVPNEVMTQFSTIGNGVYAVTAQDGTVDKVYYGTGWQRGLTTMTKSYASVADYQADSDAAPKWKKKTTTTWTQDDINLSYEKNARVTETNVDDSDGNHRRVTLGYSTPFNLPEGGTGVLPSDVYEYAATGATLPILRRSHTAYNVSSPYLDATHRIIGLPTAKYVCEGSSTETPCTDTSGAALLSKMSFLYDETGSVVYQGAPVQHDTAFDSVSITGRGNLSSIRRHDVTNLSQTVATNMVYNTAGSLFTTTDASGHLTTIGYADAFSADGVNATNPGVVTLAYPTMVTDPSGYTSSAKYHYDLGAPTWRQTPQPNTTQNLPGPQQTMLYDSVGRLQRVTNLVNNAYVRYVYGASVTKYVQSYASVNNVADEKYSIQTYDWAGHPLTSATNHPGSTGGYSAQATIYDQMGRAVKQSNPTEIDGNWSPAGDDAAGWLAIHATNLRLERPSTTNHQYRQHV